MQDFGPKGRGGGGQMLRSGRLLGTSRYYAPAIKMVYEVNCPKKGGYEFDPRGEVCPTHHLSKHHVPRPLDACPCGIE